MTKFEQIGVNRQYDSTNKYEANKSFNHSCNKGMRIECDKCSIAYVHNLIIAYFDDNKEE